MGLGGVYRRGVCGHEISVMLWLTEDAGGVGAFLLGPTLACEGLDSVLPSGRTRTAIGLGGHVGASGGS